MMSITIKLEVLISIGLAEIRLTEGLRGSVQPWVMKYHRFEKLIWLRLVGYKMNFSIVHVKCQRWFMVYQKIKYLFFRMLYKIDNRMRNRFRNDWAIKVM